jgi:hypothetical protein
MKLDMKDRNKLEENNTGMKIMNNDEDIYGILDSENMVTWYKVRFDYNGKANFYLEPLDKKINIDLYVYKAEDRSLVGFSGNGTGSHELITIYNISKNVDYFIKVENKDKFKTSYKMFHARCRIYPYIFKDINLKKYQQQDIRWGYKQLDCMGFNMRNGGCYITCGAMILGETPLVHCKCLAKIGLRNCPYPAADIAELYGRKYESSGKRDDEDRFEILKAQIFFYIYVKEIPVIARLSGSKGTHFIIIKGFDGNLSSNKKGLLLEDISREMFKVNDPGYIGNKNLLDSLGGDYNRLTHVEVMY